MAGEDAMTQAVTTGAAQAAATDGTAQAAGGQTAQAAQAAATPDAENVDALPGWAKNLIDGLRKENAGHRTAKTKAEKAASDAAAQAAQEQGKFKELYDGIKPKAERAEALEAYVTETLDAELKAVPERLKTLVPDFSDPLAKLRWVQQAKAAGVLAAPAPAQTDARDNPQAQQRAANALSPERKQELAAIYGIKPEYLPG